ncbi:MAG: hypothetical protein A2287_04170 [Candidatus Melainabacteria bacterium RIFOXYA12_FULL_32_12]|nr:MAG: hypothetical protein A2255_01795 [Candidatus Melainabacteria bacterium RIFOXYA2_FULL_32_9]OGI26522.1 MAG: hypothetical protein A2287_04170 [Candidatus Melainabacteria bacterium RIFOXYA12_FULL_32_12]
MQNLTKRQNEIINVSIKLIAESGIQNLTIKHLSEKLGISEPAIYRHYKSKLDILLGILDYFQDSTNLGFNRIYESKLSNIKKLKAIFIERCQEFAERPELAKVIFSEEIFQNDKRLSEKVTSIMKTHHVIIHKIIEEAQKNNEIRSDIPKEHIAPIIVGTLRLLVTRWRLNNFEFDITQQAKDQWNSIERLISKEN